MKTFEHKTTETLFPETSVAWMLSFSYAFGTSLLLIGWVWRLIICMFDGNRVSSAESLAGLSFIKTFLPSVTPRSLFLDATTAHIPSTASPMYPLILVASLPRRGIYTTGSSLVGAAIRAPRITSKNLISIIFCEASAIYGVIVAIILQTKLDYVPQYEDGSWPINAMTAGYAILGAGICAGFSNLFCGMCVGIVGSSCALSDAQNSTLFVKVRGVERKKLYMQHRTMRLFVLWREDGHFSKTFSLMISCCTTYPQILVVEIFGSALGLFGIIVGIILSGGASFTA